jgi:hypothetical protein
VPDGILPRELLQAWTDPEKRDTGNDTNKTNEEVGDDDY